ncbi:MAG: hypothetical protein EON88_07790 [Brevundimonas sp.]|nr:MAG: hypothetical protein EON88_07790 [Brevundimonas sp.]
MASGPVLPLIVCGFPRSGTLTCAQALSLSPTVELQGEMALPDQTLGYLAALKVWHEGQGARSALWRDRSYEVMFDAFAAAAPGRRIVRPGATYRGHKTPRHERYFDRYEALFDRPEAQARYVYCLRNPWAVWRSLKIMPWNSIRTVGAFVEAWGRSVETFERMQTTAPGRVLMFDLDAFVAARDAEAFLDETLFRPLGLDPASFLKPVSSLANNNAATVKAGRSPPPLFQDEIDRIGDDAKSRRWVERYFADVTPPIGETRGWLQRMRG